LSFIGIDIGTTRTKLSIVTRSFREILTLSEPTPPIDDQTATFSLKALIDIIDDLIVKAYRAKTLSIESVAVSAQTPSLCFPNVSSVGRCLSYLGRNAIGGCGNRAEITQKWIEKSGMECSKMGEGDVCSLTAFINRYLGGKITIDPITAWELGVTFDSLGKNLNTSVSSSSMSILSGQQILSPSDAVGISNHGCLAGARIASGTTDTIASFLGSAISLQNIMIYAGTFGSVLKSSYSSDDYYLLNTSSFERPYEWLLSVPAIGPTISTLAESASKTVPEILKIAKSREFIGINDEVVLPWFNQTGQCGDYIIPKDPIVAVRLIIETFAYLVRNVFEANKIKPDDAVLTGGLAASQDFSDIFTTAFGCDTWVADIPHGSFGTALIAAITIGNRKPELIRKKVHPNPAHEQIINEAYQRTIERHHERGWRPGIMV
jgi:sugar (pentulose or hexulose) kinase